MYRKEPVRSGKQKEIVNTQESIYPIIISFNFFPLPSRQKLSPLPDRVYVLVQTNLEIQSPRFKIQKIQATQGMNLHFVLSAHSSHSLPNSSFNILSSFSALMNTRAEYTRMTVQSNATSLPK